MRHALRIVATVVGCAAASTSFAIPFTFSSGSPVGRMAMASRPGSSGSVAIEAADDFCTLSTTSISSATLTGLLPGLAPPLRQIACRGTRYFARP